MFWNPTGLKTCDYEDGQPTLMVASIRYLDEFVKQDGEWLFAERRLMVNWTDTPPSAA